MFGLPELLFLLFSIGDMMLTTQVKPLIANTVREIMSLDPDSTNVTNSNCYENITDSIRSNNSCADWIPLKWNASIINETGFIPAVAEDRVQRRIAAYLMINLACTYIPTLFSGFVCGAWSDRYGRKLPMLLPCVGHMISTAVYALICWGYKTYLLRLLIGAALCRGLLGKGAVFSMSVCSLLSDAVPEHQRSSRFASVMAARSTGVCVGSLLSGVLQDTMGIMYGMFASAILQIVCASLIVVLFKETVIAADGNTKQERQGKKRMTALIDTVLSWCRRLAVSSSDTRSGGYSPLLSSDSNATYDTLTDTQQEVKAKGLATLEAEPGKTGMTVESTSIVSDDREDSLSKGPGEVSKARSEGGAGEQRRRWCLMLFAMVFLFFVQSMMSSQTELLVNTSMAPPLSWPPSWYGYVTAAYYGSSGLGLWLLGHCKKSMLPQSSAGDSLILIIAVLSCAVSAFWTGLASRSYHGSQQIFGAYMLAAQGLMCNSIVRTLVSKVVPSHSSGKAMAALSVLETMAKVLGPLLNTAVYVATFATSPAIVYYVMGGEGLLLVPFVLIIHYSSRSVLT